MSAEGRINTTPTDTTGTVTRAEIIWQQNPCASIPRHVLQMIVVDPSHRMLAMHRGPNVRSARNVWSFPSGLHDIGETAIACAARELHEEYNLVAMKTCFLGQYENIAGDEPGTPQYHWVITMLGVIVNSLEDAINKEPDKHDKMEFPSLVEYMGPDFYASYPMHSSMMQWADWNQRKLIALQLGDWVEGYHA